RKRAYCLKIQPATGSFARNLIYSTKPRTGALNRVNYRNTVFVLFQNVLTYHPGDQRFFPVCALYFSSSALDMWSARH
ncbi:hypothetical protein, partial [Escherichia coli]|uniref:hypothetical protein n=1 Tax=Escherichia coli TaxID=562 RepID=UPI0022702D2D